MVLLAPKYTNLIIAILDLIRENLDIAYWNKNQTQMDSPFDNTGATYSNDTFTVRAYDWDLVIDSEKEELPNFNYKDIFYVHWYKYMGRCMVVYYDESIINFDINFLAKVVNDCIESIKKDFGESSDSSSSE